MRTARPKGLRALRYCKYSSSTNKAWGARHTVRIWCICYSLLSLLILCSVVKKSHASNVANSSIIVLLFSNVTSAESSTATSFCPSKPWYRDADEFPFHWAANIPGEKADYLKLDGSADTSSDWFLNIWFSSLKSLQMRKESWALVTFNAPGIRTINACREAPKAWTALADFVVVVAIRSPALMSEAQRSGCERIWLRHQVLYSFS